MAKNKKSSLKNALSSQQSRLKKKQEVKQAVEHQAMKSKSKTKAPPQRSTIPFLPTDRILLIGEGNFSYALALVLHPPPGLEHLPSENVTATAYDSEDECYTKYPEAVQYVQTLREKGAQIMFGVDATRLEKCSPLKGKRYDRIVWNFPHAGKGITDQDRNVLSNQTLLLGFFRSAAQFLRPGPIPQATKPRKRKRAPDEDDSDPPTEDESEKGNTGARGTVLVTLRNVPPYTTWDIPRLAKNPPPPHTVNVKPNPPYIVVRSFAFNRSDWQGYEHRMTKGERAHGTGTTGAGGEDRTWEFCLRDWYTVKQLAL